MAVKKKSKNTGSNKKYEVVGNTKTDYLAFLI